MWSIILISQSFQQQKEYMNNEEWDKYPAYGEDQKKRKRKKTILLLVLIFLLAILFAVLFYFLGIWKLLQRIFPNSRLNINQASNIVSPGKLRGEDSGDIKIMFLGMRGEGEKYPKLTNGIMIADYDVKSKKMNLVSLPRDFWVPTDKYGNRKISYICDTLEYDKNPMSCFETAKYVTKQTLGIDIDYNYIVDFKGFIQIIDDTNSRVDVNIGEHYKDWPFLTEADFISAKDPSNPSLYHLNGDQSLIFVRWPENALPDFDRLYRQQIYVKAAQDMFFSSAMLLNPTKIQKVLEISGNNVVTDMQVWEAVRFAEMTKDIPPERIFKYSLTSITGSDGGFLTETNFSGATLSPKKGSFDFSDIKSWVGVIIAK